MEYSSNIIEDIMLKFKLAMGSDYAKYKNHACRVFLNCLLIDNDKSNQEKYAIAAVFHDIGIWTNHTIDYLDPSIEQAFMYLTEQGKENWIEEICLMIKWHHKLSKYQGVHAQIVENFRKSDWIDVSFGLLSFGLDKQKIKSYRRTFPNLGFHLFLIQSIAKNFFKHPFNPLPMFKK